MAKKCTCQRMTLSYPGHRFQPEDLLDFIESSEFTAQWCALGLNDEDDLYSLQMCIMVHPQGDGKIEGTDVRYHTHVLHQGPKCKRITVYYGYFRDYGIAYLSCFDETGEVVEFSEEQRVVIKMELDRVFAELQRLKSIKVGRKSATGSNNDIEAAC